MIASRCEEPLHVLVVDDNAAIHEDFRKILLPTENKDDRLDQLETALFGPEPPTTRSCCSPRQTFALHSAYDSAQAIEIVRQSTRQGRQFCVVFLDVRMPPGLDGVQTIPQLWQADPNLQIVLCTAYSDHTWNDIVQNFGYRDSLLILKKPFDSIEVLQVAHALARKWTLSLQARQRMDNLEHVVQTRTADLERSNRELRQQMERRAVAEQELRKLATHDPLTEVPNRVLLQERLHAALARAQRQQGLVALMLLDMDHFKDVNDAFGHQAGDCVLKQFTERLRACVRGSDTVARMGGDEFGILVEDIAEPEEAAIIAQRILHACTSPFDVQGNVVHVPPSVGIAIYPTDCEDAESLVQSADVALYEAKEGGRATYRYFSCDMLASSQEKLMIREQLLQAIDNDQLRVFYQPLLDARTGKIASMEALVRWQHPTLGLVPPMRFIPMAEKSGLIVTIGAWVLRTACLQLARWRELGAAHLSMAVNVSARELQSKGFVEVVKNVLDETGLAGCRRASWRGLLAFQPLRRSEYLLLQAALVVDHRRTQGRIGGGQDLHGQQARVRRVVDRDRGDRHAGRHLRNRQQRVDAVQHRGCDGHADHRQGRDGGDHAGQVRGAASAGDDHRESARSRVFRVVEHPARCAVRGDDRHFVGDAELREHVGRRLHHGQIGVAAHDDANQRALRAHWPEPITRTRRLILPAVPSAAASVGPVTVTWPILRKGCTRCLPYRWTATPGMRRAASMPVKRGSPNAAGSPSRLKDAAGWSRRVGPSGMFVTARRCCSNCDVTQASMV